MNGNVNAGSGPGPEEGNGPGDDLTDQILEELRCSICLSPFFDPRFLPCSHTFCHGCLKKVAKSSKDGRLSCPVCRRICHIHSRSEDFPQNRLAANLVDLLRVHSVDLGRPVPESRTTTATSRRTSHSEAIALTPLAHDATDLPRWVLMSLSRRSTSRAVQFIPFHVQREKCMASVEKWVESLWFTPADFSEKVAIRPPLSIFFPYFLVRVRCVSVSKARLAFGQKDKDSEHIWSPTECRRDTQMEMLFCCVNFEHRDWMQKNNSRFKWNLSNLVEITDGICPSEGTESLVLPFDFEPAEAWERFAKEALTKKEHDAARSDMDHKTLETSDGKLGTRTRLHCVEIQDLNVKCTFSNRSFVPVLIPTFWTEYIFGPNDERFFVVVNGYSAKLHGTRPHGFGSAGKVVKQLVPSCKQQ